LIRGKKKMGYLSRVTDVMGEGGEDKRIPKSNISVLVVEDEEMLAEMYEEWLSGEGYEVGVVNSGVEALKSFGEETDVVLLDRRMPFIPGDGVLDVIGSDDIKEIVQNVQSESMDFQICLVTAVEPDFDILDMNFDHYITKGVNKDELLEVVEELTVLEGFDEDVQEYQSLYWKDHILRNSKSESKLMENEGYQKLQEEMKEIENRSGNVRRIKGIDIRA